MVRGELRVQGEIIRDFAHRIESVESSEHQLNAVILAEIRDSQNAQADQIQVLIENIRHTSEESRTNYNSMGHILQRVRHLEETTARPPEAPDEVVVAIDPRVEELAQMVERQGQQLHLVQESFKREDQGVTRRPGQREPFGGNNLSRIERTSTGDSPVGSDAVFDEVEQPMARSALGAHDVTQADVMATMMVDVTQKLAETMNKGFGMVLSQIRTSVGAGGGDDGGSDGDDDEDDPPDPRIRSRRSKPKASKEDDESSEGGRPFNRPRTVDYYASKRKERESSDKSLYDFVSKDRLLRLMDANEKIGQGTKKVIQEGSSNVTEIVTTNKEHLTIDKYFLGGHPPDTLDVFRFLSMYEENVRKEPSGQLLLSKFIRLEYLTILEHSITTHKQGRFRHHYILMKANGGHIYREGSQAMTNSALAEVITYVASPKSRYRTYMVLTRSVFPHRNWKKFASVDYIQLNLRGYLHEWLAFRARFESLLDLLKHVRRHLPAFYMRRQHEDGLLDFMFKTSPCPKWMYMVLKEAKEGEGKHQIKDKDDWETIMQKLEDTLEYWADLYDQTEDANQRMLGRGKLDLDFRPPYEIEVGARREERERSKVHAVSDQEGEIELDPRVTFQLPEWEDEDFDDGGFEDGEVGDDDDEGYNTAPESRREEKASEVFESAVHKELRRDEDALLQGIHSYTESSLKQMESVVHKGKNVCWSFAEGKCAFEAEGRPCRFSHEPEDVQAYRLARTMGPKLIQGAVQKLQLKMTPGKVGSATSPGPRATSPGVRPPFRDGRTPATHGRRSSYPPKRA
jgi:hypothetical protein